MDLFSFGGSLLGGLFGKSAKDKELSYARQLNRNKIQWTVADAKKAGVSPLAALGSPVAGSWAAPSGQSSTGSHFSDAVKSLGPRYTPEQKERQRLENDLLRAQIDQTKVGTLSMAGPAMTASAAARAAANNAPPGYTIKPGTISKTGAVVTQPHITGAGTVNTPVGPGLDEIVSGFLLQGIAKLNKRHGGASSGWSGNPVVKKAIKRKYRNRKKPYTQNQNIQP